MTFDFHPEARIEFVDAVAFYEEFREGLSLRLSREVTRNRSTLSEPPA